MKKNQDNSDTPFSEACQKILAAFPLAIGVAYKVLDCGCALLCGMSAGGDPIGTLQHISGQPIKKGARLPICLKCKGQWSGPCGLGGNLLARFTAGMARKRPEGFNRTQGFRLGVYGA